MVRSMWEKAVTWLLALLALASSAGWLASRRTRSLRRIKAESELLANLPAGTARTALEAHIASSIESYLRERDAQERAQTWMLGAAVAQMLALVLLVTAEVGGAGVFDDWKEAPLWAMVVAGTGAAILVGALAVEVSLVVHGALDAALEAKPRRSRKPSAKLRGGTTPAGT